MTTYDYYKHKLVFGKILEFDFRKLLYRKFTKKDLSFCFLKPNLRFVDNIKMIKKYIIDGNNLIGKIPQIWNLQKKDKQASRVSLVRHLQFYFSKKNIKVSLHFDGFASDAIPSGNIKIKYSNNKIADTKIKEEIDLSRNPKVLAVVSSDHNIQNYAKVNSCTIIKSEEFAKQLFQKENTVAEEEIIKTISKDEIKRLFGVD